MIASIQALRALAVLLVVFNHLLPEFIPGGFVGVDIFFVISGFLITKHLLGHIRDGGIQFLSFYARRARRLLPAALTTLAVTALAVWLLWPARSHAQIFADIAAAAAYCVNWRLAFNAIDYFAADPSHSIVHHFWSLGVEEQFYLIWPLLLALAASLGGKRVRLSLETRAIALLVALGVISFVAAILAVQADSAAAYFYTHTRIWEFCVGGLAAIIAGRPNLPSRYFLWLTPTAWVALLACGWLLGPQSGVPGFAALLPTAAAALIMIAGDQKSPRALNEILRQPAIQWLGDTSYSIYLWHWPLIVMWPFLMQQHFGGATRAPLILLATLLIAALSKRYIEEPFRVSTADRPRRNGVALAVCVLLSAVVSGSALARAEHVAAQARAASQTLYAQSLDPSPCFGALANEAQSQCPHSHRLAASDFTLLTWGAQVYRPNTPHDCQNRRGDSALNPCSFGRAAGAESLHVALIGDSHAAMWIAALAELTERAPMRVDVYTASSCPPTLASDVHARSLAPEYRQACRDWRRAAITAIAGSPSIDIVIVSAYANDLLRLTPSGDWTEDDGTGFSESWELLLAAGKRVLVLDDVPRFPFDPLECLATTAEQDDPCTIPSSAAPWENPLSRAAGRIHDPRFHFVTFRDVFCDAATCHTVIGGIPAFMDVGHVSAPFARSLAPRLAPYLTPHNAPSD